MFAPNSHEFLARGPFSSNIKRPSDVVKINDLIITFHFFNFGILDTAKIHMMLWTPNSHLNINKSPRV